MKYFHPKCVGCAVVVDGKADTISRVLKDGLHFRLKSEEGAAQVKDYGFDDLTKARDLLMSDDKKTWIQFSFAQTKL